MSLVLILQQDPNSFVEIPWRVSFNPETIFFTVIHVRRIDERKQIEGKKTK